MWKEVLTHDDYDDHQHHYHHHHHHHHHHISSLLNILPITMTIITIAIPIPTHDHCQPRHLAARLECWKPSVWASPQSKQRSNLWGSSSQE